MIVAELKKIWEPPPGQIASIGTALIMAHAPLSFLVWRGPNLRLSKRQWEGNQPRDFTEGEDDNVLVQGVANDVNALGFFGYAYYAENTSKLKAVAVDNGKGPVGPSEKTVLDGSYQPLSRPIYIYVSKKALAKPEVREFAEFYLQHAPKLVKEVKYVPLPQKVYSLGASRVKSAKVGTAFGGHADVGVTIDDLMKENRNYSDHWRNH
jgi:phosphate transport system substrate-binding protein